MSVEKIANEVLYFPLTGLPCDDNHHLEWVGKITKEESHRAFADESKGYGRAGMENSGNKTEASLKNYAALYAWIP